MAKRKQLAFQDLLSIPKNDITYFGAQMKGLLKTSEPIDNPRMVLTLID